MRKCIVFVLLVFLLLSHACAEPLTALEYVQSLGVDVVQNGNSPGWRSCVYNETAEEDGLKWCAIGFSDEQYSYLINDAADNTCRQLFFDLVKNYDWDISICDDQSTDLYDKSFGVTESIDKVIDNYYDKDAYLDSVRTFLKIPDRAYVGEFLFRSYPWKINIADFSDLIAAEIYPSFSENSALSINYHVVEKTDTLQIFSPDNDFYLKNASCAGLDYTFYEAYIPSDGSTSMAGYSEYTVELRAIPGIKNGIISSYSKDTMVISATYHISYKKPQPGQTIYDDLYAKLTSIYGNCTESVSSSGTTVDIWLGTHDTYLQLMHTELSSGDGLVSVSYGLSNIQEMLDELSILSMPQANSSDTNGL